MAHHLDGGGGLLDLDANDGDLLSHNGMPMFPISPVGNQARPRTSPSEDARHSEQSDPEKIRVVVRKRPLNNKERDKGEDDIVDVYMDKANVIVHETKAKVDLTKYVEKHQFKFDVSLDESVTNEQVYQTTVKPLVPTLFKNGKATCFAYGQTGSGKTHTMTPLPTRTAADILKYLASPNYSELTLFVSCFEIYGNKVFDLLNNRKKLNILEDAKKRVVVVGLKEHSVQNVDNVQSLLAKSGENRSTGSTAANADSSRSHSIMQFALKKATPDGQSKLVGKISFIDLAGSERGADTFDNNRQTRLEGAEINKSLLALKECIRALDSEARHVPFRGSKLTAVLRDSFVGDQARTVMIANISPNNTSVEHTLNTLRYADRVKELRKDKADRAPGGVTPGDNPGYYAAVQRAHLGNDGGHHVEAAPAPLPVRARSPVKVGAPPRTPQRAEKPSSFDPGLCRDEDEIFDARDELMNTILEEEEELITAHRVQIEETMELVRKEMNLLTEVDQPGSAIDIYVDKLEDILSTKAKGISALLAKLESFKSKLREEEIMSRTAGKVRNGRP